MRLRRWQKVLSLTLVIVAAFGFGLDALRWYGHRTNFHAEVREYALKQELSEIKEESLLCRLDHILELPDDDPMREKLVETLFDQFPDHWSTNGEEQRTLKKAPKSAERTHKALAWGQELALEFARDAENNAMWSRWCSEAANRRWIPFAADPVPPHGR